MAPKLKMTEAGAPEIKDGWPVVVLEDGAEQVLDAQKLYNTIEATRKERDKAMERLRGLESEVVHFGQTPEEREAARERLKLAKNLDEKKLVDAGKIDEVVSARLKDAMTEAQKKEEMLAAALKESQRRIRALMVEAPFAKIKDILPGTVLTPTLGIKLYSDFFDVEGDQVVAYRSVNGTREKVYSPSNPNQLASFEEALRLIYNADPDRAHYQLGTNATGPGANGRASEPATTRQGASVTVSRTHFNGLTPAAQMAHIKAGGAVTD